MRLNSKYVKPNRRALERWRGNSRQLIYGKDDLAILKRDDEVRQKETGPLGTVSLYPGEIYGITDRVLRLQSGRVEQQSPYVAVRDVQQLHRDDRTTQRKKASSFMQVEANSTHKTKIPVVLNVKGVGIFKLVLDVSYMQSSLSVKCTMNLEW